MNNNIKNIEELEKIIEECSGEVVFRKINRGIGIYLIKIGSHLYIGSTANKLGLSERINQHRWLLHKNNHYNVFMQNIYNKCYNIEAYVIHYCDAEECVKFEQHYVDTINPDMNICKIVEKSCLGVKRRKETIDKLSKSLRNIPRTPEWRKNMSLSRLGKKLSEEQKLKISIANTGKKMSEKNILRISKPIKQYDLDGNFIETFASSVEVERKLGFKYQPIVRCSKGKLLSAYGFVWRYLDDPFDKYRIEKFNRKNTKSSQWVSITFEYDNQISQFDNITKASEYTGINRKTIEKLLKSGKSYKGNNKYKGIIFKITHED